MLTSAKSLLCSFGVGRDYAPRRGLYLTIPIENK